MGSSTRDGFFPFQSLSKALTENEVSHRVDDSSGSIGRRYARTDEVAIPFGICVDFDSMKEPPSATVRERDSTLQVSELTRYEKWSKYRSLLLIQVRMPIDDIPRVLRLLSTNRMTWDEVQAKYPKFEQQESSSK